MKNGDIPGVQKLVAKIKASKSSEYPGTELRAPSPLPGSAACPGVRILVPSKPGCACWLCALAQELQRSRRRERKRSPCG